MIWLSVGVQWEWKRGEKQESILWKKKYGERGREETTGKEDLKVVSLEELKWRATSDINRLFLSQQGFSGVHSPTRGAHGIHMCWGRQRASSLKALVIIMDKQSTLLHFKDGIWGMERLTLRPPSLFLLRYFTHCKPQGLIQLCWVPPRWFKHLPEGIYSSWST